MTTIRLILAVPDCRGVASFARLTTEAVKYNRNAEAEFRGPGLSDELPLLSGSLLLYSPTFTKPNFLITYRFLSINSDLLTPGHHHNPYPPSQEPYKAKSAHPLGSAPRISPSSFRTTVDLNFKHKPTT